MAEIQASLPGGADAADAHGAVRVRVGRDGLPEHISAATDWQRRISPETLGHAITEAARNAASAFMEEWGRNLPDGPWGDRSEAGTVGTPPPVRQAQEHPVDDPPERDLRYVLPRPVDDMAEEAIAALESAGNTAPEALRDAQGTGSDRGRHVTLTLVPGSLASCDMDTGWAARESTVKINGALSEALEDARSALARATLSGQAQSVRQQMDGLLDESLAILQDPRRLNDLR